MLPGEIVSPELQAQAEEALPEFMDYRKFKVRLDKRIGDWKDLEQQAEQNRKDRYIDFDVEKARQDGEIEQDETWVPTRVIDSNLIREKADAMTFLNSGKRLAYFISLEDPNIDTRQMESDTTKALTYKGWYKTFDRHFDAAGLHGWCSIETLYDESKPGHVGFELIAFEDLLFNLELEDIQDDDFIMIRRNVSCYRLEEFIRDFNFNEEQVGKILQKTDTNQKRDSETNVIYKVYYKHEGQVFICWYTKDANVSDFLKAPEPFISGILEQIQIPTDPNQPEVLAGLVAPMPVIEWADKPSARYPVELFIYKDDEQECIVKHKGRAFLDAPQQEARTAIKTAFVNGTLRASNTYCSVDSDDPEAANRLEEVILEGGTILKVPLRFHNQPYPDPTVIQTLQYMDMENSQQSGKMAVAVSNRKDSRKTAEELQQAQGEERKITSVGLANYSEFLRNLLGYAWEIIQSQALAERIAFCRKLITTQVPGPAGLAGIPQEEYKNDIELLSKKYEIRAAGDVDVIQKQERLAVMQQDWPVIQTIPGLSQLFLQDFLRLRYPEKADQYIAAMQAGNPGKQVAQSLLAVVQGSLQPEEVNALPPEKQQELKQVLAMAEQYVANPAM